MGCDIHIFVEKRINGKWECIDTIIGDENGNLYVPYENRIYTERNYSLFALLANVRNHAKIISISEPRGLPDDVSEIVKEISYQWDCDGHSHSYYTLEELLNYNPEHLVKQVGYMSKETWTLFQESLKTSKPNYDLRFPYAGWSSSGMGWERHEWEVPAKVISPNFFIETLNKLKEIGKPEDVRIVFWFDN